MAFHSKWIGENLVQYADQNEQRWLDVIGENALRFRCDQGVDIATAQTFTVTATGTAPVTNAITEGDAIKIVTAATEYSGDTILLLGSAFKFVADKPAYCGSKIAIDDATSTDLAFGFSAVDTAFSAASVAHGLKANLHLCLWHKDAGATTIKYATGAGSTYTDTAISNAMDVSAHIYEILWDGAGANFYFDGVLKARVTTTLPTNVMTPALAFRSGASAAAQTALISWWRAFQAR